MKELQTQFSRIVAQFSLNKRHYLLIHLEDITEFNLNYLTSQLIFSQVAIAGETFAIIEAKNKSNDRNILPFITERESQIVQLVAKGKSNKQIAIALNISEWTVSTHLRRIFAKLDVDNRAAMVHRCAPILS